VSHFASDLALIGMVLVAACLFSGVLERIGVPIVAAFLLLGAVLGPFGLSLLDIGFQSPALHALATLGLVLVLFSDAVTLQISQLRAVRPLLWRVLGPGTLIPALLTALAAWLLLDVPPAGAAILGAALASTDPVLLRSLIRSRALPPAASLALRVETGMNDIVLLPIVILAMLVLRQELPGAPGGGLPGRELVRSALGLFALGPAFGALVGWAGIAALARVRSRYGVRRDYESLYALGLAFTAYAAAEAVGGSGFVAAFVAGVLVAAQDVELCDCFLEYGEATAELLLLLTFVALGASLIWLGLTSLDWRVVLFAAIALSVRTVVLYPVLARAGMPDRERRLVALFGPRGLSSLLYVLLPVFAGLPGAERLFAITAFVVLLSVVLHGGGIALFIRRRTVPVPGAPTVAEEEPPEVVPELITLDEMKALQARGEPVVIVDARADRNYDPDTITAAGAVRLHPNDPVRDATERRLSQRATLVVYCA
jgi:sodium/hydrogen antiporter